jgi:hypothetical protein
VTVAFVVTLQQELVGLFGTDWAIDYLIPYITDIRRHKSYLRRLTALQACAMMATVMEAEAARSEMLPLVLEMATDVASIFGALTCVLL